MQANNLNSTITYCTKPIGTYWKALIQEEVSLLTALSLKIPCARPYCHAEGKETTTTDHSTTYSLVPLVILLIP